MRGGGDKKYVELIVGRRSVMYCACCGRNHVGQEYNPSLQGVSEYNPTLNDVSEYNPSLQGVLEYNPSLQGVSLEYNPFSTGCPKS